MKDMKITKTKTCNCVIKFEMSQIYKEKTLQALLQILFSTFFFFQIYLAGVNPKINNMLPAYRAAAHPLILVSDSSIKMKEDTLDDMVAAMTENVGLVHQMPCESLPSLSCDSFQTNVTIYVESY